MSKYEERLATKEALRDPYDQAPPEDEDEPSGILRRKLSVSFGSRFKGRGKESIQDSISEVFADTPVIHVDDDDDDKASMNPANVDSFNKDFPPSSAGKVVIPKIVGGTRRKMRTAPEMKVIPNLAFVAGDSESGRKRGVEVIEEREKVSKASRTPSESTSPSTTSASEEPTPPEGWIKAFSNKQNKHYWYNVNTKKSVWEFPKE